MKYGLVGYYIMAFFGVFMLQAGFSIVVNAAALFSTIFTIHQGLQWNDWLGLAVWIIGFVIEVVGDY